MGLAGSIVPPAVARSAAGNALSGRASALSTAERITAYEDATSYNTFYEFGTGKGAPAQRAHRMRPRPGSVGIDGEVHRQGPIDLEDLLKLAPMEERIYRLRCIEAWSMVVPWVGFPLAELIKQVEPTGNARYVAFTTHLDRMTMPGTQRSVLPWPYTEGLRLDEAMHPLTVLCFGAYGEVLPNQNGAPVRIVVPWKYGIKSAKSIVRITFTEREPKTAWAQTAPQEYGFYSNVNPDIDHPRWSQTSERRIGDDGFFARRRKTLMFNGYGEQVASLYAGMDLRANY